MAYRRSNDDRPFSSRWRRKHVAELTARGIPAQIAHSDDLWRYTLNHGDDLETGWSASWLTNDQARELLAFLQPFFPDAELVLCLQRRFA